MESLKPERKPELFEKIDRKAPALMGALASAPVFKKHGQVHARRAVVGESIITTLESGIKETENTAQEGDWIITNPDGEEYIISENKFNSRYEPTNEDGLYEAKGSCRAIVNPFGKPIEIMASWGSPQTGGSDCMIADTCDDDGSNMNGEPYIIDADAFAKTYQ
ncbi:MAG: PGDYG domain-containing protein [Patescibacteria group bacterium]